MIRDILDEIGSTQSRNEKESILEKHKDNNILQIVLEQALNPFVSFYIKKLPEYKPAKSGEEKLTLSQSINILLHRLSERTVTGNEARELVSTQLTALNEQDADVLARILQKDLRCGIAVATVNKIFGDDFIPTFPCMLAQKQTEKTMESIEFPAILQQKMDGMRINAIVTEGKKVEYRSRNGKIVDCGHELLNHAVIHAAHCINLGTGLMDVVFDGELLVIDPYTKKFEDRKKSNGIANKAIKGTISDEERKKFFFVCWDVIPLVDFLKGSCTSDYGKRWGEFFRDFANVEWKDEEPYMGLIQTLIVNDWNEASKITEEMIAEGKEGSIIKNIFAPWENKRSKHQVKMKQSVDGDFVIKDWIEGTGKYVGMLGSLSCESADGKVRFNVGSGFTDEQRKQITKDVIGKIVTVKYNERIRDKKNPDVESLFLPVFVEIRDDKDTANSIGELV